MHRRETTLGASEIRNTAESAASKKHIGRSGRSNSAPDSYCWAQNRQKSIETNLEAVKEVILDQNEEVLNTAQIKNSRSQSNTNDELAPKEYQVAQQISLKQEKIFEPATSDSTHKYNIAQSNDGTDEIMSVTIVER